MEKKLLEATLLHKLSRRESRICVRHSYERCSCSAQGWGKGARARLDHCSNISIHKLEYY